MSPDDVIAYIWFDLAAISGDEGTPNRTGSTMTDDNSKDAAAAFIAASLRNLIRMTEAHKDLEFLGYLMDAAREEAENQTG